MNIAIIPARGGSKRIPRKNIKFFAGKPMIAYAIEAAKASTLFNRIIVSTDDDEIANVAAEYGGEIFFKRPLNLADDHTPTIPVIAHAIGECERLEMTIDNVCCIYPSVPFIQVDDLKLCYQLLQETEGKFSFPVTEFPSAIYRAFSLDKLNKVVPLFPEYELVRTQDLQKTYHDVGQFYWASRDSWLNTSKIHANGVGLVIPNNRVVDIDTMNDWSRAEMIWKSFDASNN